MGIVAEEWRSVPGGPYKVSSLGRVLSTYRGVDRELTLKEDHGGYLRVQLVISGRSKYCSVHGLVARAFHGERGGDLKLHQVNHINGVKTDNRACNLEWLACKENHLHAVRLGLRERIGVGHFRRKLSMHQVECVRRLSVRGVSRKFMARWFGVSVQTIMNIVNNKSYQS